MLWFTIKTDHLKPITIVDIYRPPSGNITNFIETLNTSLENLDIRRDNDLFILGDMNLDMLNKKDKNVSTFKNKMSRHSLLQLIKEPTRLISPGKGSLLDLCFTNSSHIIQYGVGSWNLSDHELIHITRKHKTKTKVKASFDGRTYRNYDLANFQNEIKNLSWNYFFTI